MSRLIYKEYITSYHKVYSVHSTEESFLISEIFHTNNFLGQNKLQSNTLTSTDLIFKVKQNFMEFILKQFEYFLNFLYLPGLNISPSNAKLELTKTMAKFIFHTYNKFLTFKGFLKFIPLVFSHFRYENFFDVA